MKSVRYAEGEVRRPEARSPVAELLVETSAQLLAARSEASVEDTLGARELSLEFSGVRRGEHHFKVSGGLATESEPAAWHRLTLPLLRGHRQVGGLSALRSGSLPFDPGALSLLLRVEVEDSGVGMPKERLSRTFEPFFTTKAQGTGLGLAVVKRIMDEHAGELEVASELGQGTRFTFRFPLQGDEVRA
jgi:signal transduction histidine kinase